MARLSRADEEGSWHHAGNRGIAKRPLFETRDDKRFFLARFIRQIRLGRLELHAYCLMTTHFHVLVRSPIGELSEAMRRVQNEHSRRFNRRNRRDGALVRGRFFSKPVRSEFYRRTLVRYIDSNPVRAGIVRSSAHYEFGSAAAYMTDSGPRWLHREWVESAACRTTGAKQFTPEVYQEAFGARNKTELAEINELVDARLSHRAAEDPLDDLVGTAPQQVQAWMQRKTRLADGHQPGLPLCGPRALGRAIAENRSQHGVWMVEDGRNSWRGADLAQIGLLRDLCGLAWREIAPYSEGSLSRARRLGTTHQRLMRTNPTYAMRVTAVAQAAVLR